MQQLSALIYDNEKSRPPSVTVYVYANHTTCIVYIHTYRRIAVALLGSGAFTPFTGRSRMLPESLEEVKVRDFLSLDKSTKHGYLHCT